MAKKLKNWSISRMMILFLLRIISLINSLVPKKKNKILIYAPESNFVTDNSLYLLRYLHDYKYDDYKVNIFLPQKDESSITMIEKYSDFYFYNSTVKGIFDFLTSKYVFYSFGTMRINPSSKQEVIMLDHGAPLKAVGKAEKGVRSLEKQDHFNRVVLLSSFFDEAIKETYHCGKDKFLYCGFPRNDYLLKSCSEVENLKNIFNLNKYNKNIIWMPTFRKLGDRYRDLGEHFDYDSYILPTINNLEDLYILNKTLAKKNYSLTIKIHPAEKRPDYSFSNIKFVKNNYYESYQFELYDVLCMYDMLISDYSSIIWDYLLLDKPIVFVYDDKDVYREHRGLLISNYEELFNSYVAETFEQFLELIENIPFLVSREPSSAKLIHKYPDGNNIPRLLSMIGIHKN